MANPAPTASSPTPTLPQGQSYAPSGITGGGGLFQAASGLDLANQLFNFYQSADAPQNQAIYNKIGNYQQQLAALGAGQQYQAGLINQSQQTQLAGLDLSGQQQDVQRQALARQMGLLPQEQALTGQQFDIMQAGLDQNAASAKASYGSALEAQRGSAAARGATTSPSNVNAQADMARSLQDTLGNIGRQGQQLSLSRQQSNLSAGEQQAKLQDAQKNLDILAQKTGLDRQDIENRTQQALQQLGLSTYMSTSDIYNAISDAQAGLYNPATQVLGTIYQMTGLRP